MDLRTVNDKIQNGVTVLVLLVGIKSFLLKERLTNFIVYIELAALLLAFTFAAPGGNDRHRDGSEDTSMFCFSSCPSIGLHVIQESCISIL